MRKSHLYLYFCVIIAHHCLLPGYTRKYLQQESANVNDSGNFSIQVLRAALERFHNIELVPWFQNRDGDNLDPLLQKGFVVNRWANCYYIESYICV